MHCAWILTAYTLIIIDHSFIIIIIIILHTGYKDFTSIAAVSEPGPAYYTSSGLSGELNCEYVIIMLLVHCWHAYAGGGIAAIVIGAVLIIIGLSVTLTIIFAKLKYYKRQYVVQSWKSELR